MGFTVNGVTESGQEAAVQVLVRERTFPNAQVSEDANWLNARVQVTLPGYRAGFDGRIRAEDFPIFLRDLKLMHKSGHGTAEFSPPNDLVELRADLSDSGALNWSGMTTFPPEDGSVLSFAFSGDPATLPELIRTIEEATKRFRVIG